MKGNFKKIKFIFLAIALIFSLFFSNDFGLIDVEKTAIITALAIDIEQGEYVVSAQVAVPEATDTNSENQKAELIGKGSTVGSAIKQLGDRSGWFPKLSFCNLILLGASLKNTNVVDVLDYFAKTLRVQDSALVAFGEDKASELLKVSTPLDNISSFAIQKVLLKNPGFDRNVSTNNIKAFCSGHYSKHGSAFMPIVKIIKLEQNQDSSSSQGGDSTSKQNQGSTKTNGKCLFDAKTTALFKNGYKVGELDQRLTLVFNAINNSIVGTTIEVNDVEYKHNTTCNYLVNVMGTNQKLKLIATDSKLTLDIGLNVFCKVSDQNSDYSDQSLSKNLPLPKPLKDKLEQMLTNDMQELIQVSKATTCDFLNLKEKLYRFNYKQYSRYKDNYLDSLTTKISVNAWAQR